MNEVCEQDEMIANDHQSAFIRCLEVEGASFVVDSTMVQIDYVENRRVDEGEHLNARIGTQGEHDDDEDDSSDLEYNTVAQCVQ